MLTQVVFFLNLLSQNLAAIVACAQMFDAFGANFWPGATYALRLSPAPVTLVRWDSSLCGIGDVAQADPDSGADACVPFASEGEGALLMTAGYLATMLLLAPLGLLTLEENMLQQKFSFCALFALSIQFLFTFLSTGLTAGSLPWIGHHWAESLGVVIFNFAFCVTVPRCSALACLTCIPEASPCIRMHEDGNPRKALPALIIALSVTTRAASITILPVLTARCPYLLPRDRSWLNERLLQSRSIASSGLDRYIHDSLYVRWCSGRDGIPAGSGEHALADAVQPRRPTHTPLRDALRSRHHRFWDSHLLRNHALQSGQRRTLLGALGSSACKRPPLEYRVDALPR